MLVAWWLLRLLHCIMTSAWVLAVLIFTNRAGWFTSGALGWSHVATGLWLLFPRDVLPQSGRTLKDFAYGQIAVASLALVPVVLYASFLTAAIVAPDAGLQTETKTLAAAMWSSDRAISIAVFVMLGLTAALHVTSIIVMSPLLAKKTRED